jgi:hypothetical protein
MVGLAHANPTNVTIARIANIVFILFCELHLNSVTSKPSRAVIASPLNGICQGTLIEFMGPEILQEKPTGLRQWAKARGNEEDFNIPAKMHGGWVLFSRLITTPRISDRERSGGIQQRANLV